MRICEAAGFAARRFHLHMKKIAILLFLVLAFACKRAEKPVASGDAGNKPRARGAAAPAATTSTGTDVGAAMPEYSAMGLDGSKFELASKRDKVVLLNLWATWCPPCRAELPELQSLHTKYAARGFEVIGVSVDESGVETVRNFVTEQKLTYPIVLDPEGKLANILQTSSLPTSVLLDRDGKIIWKSFTMIEPNDPALAKVIEKAL